MFSSIKVKLSFYFSLLLIFILLTLGTIAYYFISDKIKHKIDEHLNLEADEMIYTLTQKDGQVKIKHIDEWSEDEHLPGSHSPIYVEIMQNGKIVLKTQNITEPLQNWEKISIGYHNSVYNNVQTRAIVKPIISYNDTIGYINTTITIKELDDIQNSFIRISILLSVIAIITSFGAGYILTKRFLRPIQHISNHINNMKTSKLESIINQSNDKEILEIINELNQYFDRLEVTIRSIKQFSADASHELKTPLAIMKSEIEQSLQTDSVVNFKELSFSLLDEIQRLQDMTDKLTQLSLIENQELNLEVKSVWLNDIIFNEINRVESLLLKKGLAIDTSGIDSISCMGDKNWLNILFRNIIDNAIKFSFENNIIKIVVTIHNEMALVSIRDYGTGVSDNELELLTSRFFRSHNIENSTSGSGLGLSICNWIVNKHNGDITFKSHRPGLEVQIMIPIK